MLKKTMSHLILHIHVRPNAKVNAVREVNANRELRLDIAADAQSGKANQELTDYLKSILKIPSNQLEIIHGHQQRDKVVRIFAPENEHEKFIESLRSEISSKWICSSSFQMMRVWTSVNHVRHSATVNQQSSPSSSISLLSNDEHSQQPSSSAGDSYIRQIQPVADETRRERCW